MANLTEIKSNILMNMQDILDVEGLRKLKQTLDISFYNVTVLDETTDIALYEGPSIYDLLNKYSLEKRIQGLSCKTIAQYLRETKKFLDAINKPITDITSDHVLYYLSTYISKGVSNTTVDNARKYLKSFFSWLYENEYIKKDIFLKIKPIKIILKDKEYLTDNEITSLRDVAREDTRALAIIDFLFSTGLRVSEFTNLKLKNIDFNTGEVRVYATKTSQWRNVYLDSNALKHLTDYLNKRKDSSEYVFTNVKVSHRTHTVNKMSNTTVQQIIQKYAKQCNITKECTVHIFRKTLATRMYSHNIDISIIAKILGHNSIKTTEKYYLTIKEADVKSAYNKYM